MKITTTIATHYLLRLVFLVTVPCIAFTAWGAYDLWIKYPYQRWTNDLHDAHRELLDKQEARTISALQPADERLVVIANQNQSLPEDQPLPTETATLDRLEQLTTQHPRATPPSAFDDAVCWIFMSCILAVPWAAWRIYRLRSRTIALDDAGLHLPTGETWTHNEIASIDMSRWMEKSIAGTVHRDGRRIKMDAYLYKDLEHIIGTIAHRFEPEKWNPDGTLVKTAVRLEAPTEAGGSPKTLSNGPESMSGEREDLQLR